MSYQDIPLDGDHHNTAVPMINIKKKNKYSALREGGENKRFNFLPSKGVCEEPTGAFNQASLGTKGK